MDQFCIIDKKFLRDIPLHEFLEDSFLKSESGATASKAISNFVQWHNCQSAFVTRTILMAENVQERAKLISKFIKVAHGCLEVKNYSSSMAIFSGLNRSYIDRLKMSWSGVPMKVVKKNQSLNQTFSVDGNFQCYRDSIKSVSSPCIPVLSIIHRDLIYIAEGNPDYVGEDKKLINFEKYAMIAQQLLKIKEYQNSRYQFIEKINIRKEIESLPFMSEDELWELSMSIEPNLVGTGDGVNPVIRVNTGGVGKIRQTFFDFGNSLKLMIADEDKKDLPVDYNYALTSRRPKDEDIYVSERVGRASSEHQRRPTISGGPVATVKAAPPKPFIRSSSDLHAAMTSDSLKAYTATPPKKISFSNTNVFNTKDTITEPLVVTPLLPRHAVSNLPPPHPFTRQNSALTADNAPKSDPRNNVLYPILAQNTPATPGRNPPAKDSPRKH